MVDGGFDANDDEAVADDADDEPEENCVDVADEKMMRLMLLLIMLLETRSVLMRLLERAADGGDVAACDDADSGDSHCSLPH